MRPSLSSYIAAVGLAQGPLIPTGLSTRIILTRAEELFYIVNYSRVEQNEEIIAADPAAQERKLSRKSKSKMKNSMLKPLLRIIAYLTVCASCAGMRKN